MTWAERPQCQPDNPTLRTRDPSPRCHQATPAAVVMAGTEPVGGIGEGREASWVGCTG